MYTLNEVDNIFEKNTVRYNITKFHSKSDSANKQKLKGKSQYTLTVHLLHNIILNLFYISVCGLS